MNDKPICEKYNYGGTALHLKEIHYAEKIGVNELQSKGYNISKIVLKHGHHKCKCCGLIADGTSKDILCKEYQDKYHVGYEYAKKELRKKLNL